MDAVFASIRLEASSIVSEGWPTHERVLDELPFGIWVARAPTGEGLYANASFRAILGMGAVSGADIAAAPATYGIFDRQGNPYPAEKLSFSRALATGGPVVVDDLVVHRHDGRKVYLRAFANPMRDGVGEVSHVDSVAHRVGERAQ
ncbi:MAG TPA: PAS domain-containing protein, partial [Polyangiaceae bacterium]|nr:PAS domain-containing protein [Polyangiaceae bacterium]